MAAPSITTIPLRRPRMIEAALTVTGLGRRWSACCLLWWLVLTPALAEDDLFLQVVDPYLEFHSGPGRGYPVVFVVERGEWVYVLKRKTAWFKVRSEQGREGWVPEQQLERTLTGEGELIEFPEPALTDFQKRRFEAGLFSGGFQGATLIGVGAAYHFIPELALEFSFARALGNFSSIGVVSAGMVADPFTDWRAAPFFVLGMSGVKTEPRTTLVQERDREDPAAHVGLGLRAYFWQRFLLRAEYRNYMVFSSNDDNEDVNEWRVGLAFFY
ncbi:MAG TPA: hypothetical protein ENJ19_01300 [Gammaproteobacteria bacterium]|nr:hypothetical protein [Gammaproteobacteria bacterium]